MRIRNAALYFRSELWPKHFFCLCSNNLNMIRYTECPTHSFQKGKCCPRAEKCPPFREGRGVNDTATDDVCDSDGQRHRSRCLFEAAKCRAEKIEGRSKALEERYCPAGALERTGGETERGGGQHGTERERAGNGLMWGTVSPLIRANFDIRNLELIGGYQILRKKYERR